MMETKTISVIVPVYNAEKTLHRCVDSLLNQEYQDAEIILINDGSTDSSDELCSMYQALDDRIVYLKKENGGVSSARNAGLDHARGKYITFVDSDDYVESDYFDTISRLVVKNDSDWIHFSNTLIRGDKSTARKRSSVSLANQDLAISEICNMIWHKLLNSPWDKVYKRQILDCLGLHFPEDIEIGEDWAFNVIYSCYVQSFVGSEQQLYCVCEDREDSLSRKPREDLNEQIQKAICYVREKVSGSPLSERNYAKLIEAINFYELSIVYTKAKNLQKKGVGYLERQRELHMLCKRENKKKLQYPNSFFCRLVSIPVKMRLAPVIDYIARTGMR